MEENIQVTKYDLHGENVISVWLNLFIPGLIISETIDTSLFKGRLLFTHLTYIHLVSRTTITSQ